MTTPSAPRRRIPRAARPFRVHEYRVLVFALMLSLLGAGTWLVAIVFQVRELGGGPTELSLVATAGAIGLVVAVLFGGAVADRIPQKRILLAVEIGKTVIIGTIAALALAGVIELWHLAVAAAVIGIADGFFYPAYSALLPAILPEGDLLAANGVEGTLRPVILNAAGPVLASSVIALAAPSFALAVVAALQLLAAAALMRLRTTAVRRDLGAEGERGNPVAAMFVDIRDGFVYVVKTPWLLATLLFASLLVLVIIGPIEVLLPFAVTDQTGGGAESFALVLAAFGAGSAVSSLIVASLRLPRRYLTVMVVAWGFGSAPLVVIGLTGELWAMALAVFVVGATYSVGQVIWGTLLQRRVPPAMLGRVSSLDFFVSLVFMPVSMALAGPVGERFGYAPTFVAAGTIPVVLAVVTIVVARMPRDELAHPLAPADDLLVLGATELLEPVAVDDDDRAADDGPADARGPGGTPRA